MPRFSANHQHLFERYLNRQKPIPWVTMRVTQWKPRRSYRPTKITPRHTPAATPPHAWIREGSVSVPERRRASSIGGNLGYFQGSAEDQCLSLANRSFTWEPWRSTPWALRRCLFLVLLRFESTLPSLHQRCGPSSRDFCSHRLRSGNVESYLVGR